MRTALAFVVVLSGCGRVGIDALVDATPIPDAAPVTCTVDGAACDDGNICTPTSTCAAGLCTGMGATSCLVARSDNDFSLEQGTNGWFYGFYNLTADADANYHAATDFETGKLVDTLWRPPSWEQSGDNFTWAYLASWGGHPGSYPAHRASVRRWVSDVSGAAIATIKMAKADTGGGDGTRALLFVDGVKVFDRTIDGKDGTGFEDPVPIDLAIGSTVDLFLDPVGSDSVDTTSQTMTIKSR